MDNEELCPICQSTDLAPIATGIYHQCRSCSFQLPLQSPFSGVVTNQFPKPPSGRGTFLARCQARLAMRVQTLSSFLDIGCGNGEYLYALSRVIKDHSLISGVELDSVSVAAARKAGLNISSEIAESTDNALITFWHVAEHIQVSELRSILSRLSTKNNHLLLSVPNGSSVCWEICGEAFSFFDVESHVSQFSVPSLLQLLDQSGWKVVKNFRSPWYGIFNAIQTTINLSRPHNELYNLMKRGDESPSLRLFFNSLFVLLRRVPTWCRLLLSEFSVSRASSITLLAVPKESRN